MDQPRRKIFGPLFHGTLVVSLLATAGSIFICFKPDLDNWLESRSLIELIHSDSSRDRESAARKLSRIDPEKAEFEYRQATRDSKAEIRVEGYRALVALRLDASDLMHLLREAASDHDSSVRIEAARGLGSLAKNQAMKSKLTSRPQSLPPDLHSAGIGILNTLLEDPEPEVRLAAIEAVVSFGGDPVTSRILADASDDPEGAIRLASARALIALDGPNDPSAVNAITSLVIAPNASEQRSVALDLLKDMDISVRDRTLVRLGELLDVADPETRYDAMKTLATSGPWARAALPALRKIGPEDDPEFRALARLTMARIEGLETPRGAEILVEMVTDKTLMEPHRYEALELLRASNLASLSQVTPGLILQLGDSDLAIRQYAHELLAGVIVTMPAEMPTPGTGR
ncbi:HEAT repeat domain-containing protein [Tundrisphaera lichenicola]|uniref:HEAT repeat domain-containing protein n=1 Tax=Tundrisphaera lichenicola TaxID=2029860 RepID=UPI003EB7E54F